MTVFSLVLHSSTLHYTLQVLLFLSHICVLCVFINQLILYLGGTHYTPYHTVHHSTHCSLWGNSGNIVLGAGASATIEIAAQIRSPLVTLGENANVRMEAGTEVTGGSITLEQLSSFHMATVDVLWGDSCSGLGTMSSSDNTITVCLPPIHTPPHWWWSTTNKEPLVGYHIPLSMLVATEQCSHMTPYIYGPYEPYDPCN